MHRPNDVDFVRAQSVCDLPAKRYLSNNQIVFEILHFQRNMRHHGDVATGLAPSFPKMVRYISNFLNLPPEHGRKLKSSTKKSFVNSDAGADLVSSKLSQKS